MIIIYSSIWRKVKYLNKIKSEYFSALMNIWGSRNFSVPFLNESDISSGGFNLLNWFIRWSCCLVVCVLAHCLPILITQLPNYRWQFDFKLTEFIIISLFRLRLHEWKITLVKTAQNYRKISQLFRVNWFNAAFKMPEQSSPNWIQFSESWIFITRKFSVQC